MADKNKEMKLKEACSLKKHIFDEIDCTNRFPLSQSSINEEGNIRISEPGYYYLIEDIIFDIHIDMQQYLFTKPEKSERIFGNHSGIIIECDYVMLDLCGHSLSQSARFYAVQRFFNLIQFNNFPFIKNSTKPCVHLGNGVVGCPVVGPIPNVLIEEFHTPKYIVIKNGCFGLTSHTGIHGNNNSFIVVENIIAKDFEVSMITLNKAERVVIDNICIENSLNKVPFTPFFATIILAIKSFLSIDVPLSELSALTMAIGSLVNSIDGAITLNELCNLSENSDFDNSVNNYLSPCGQFGISITKKGPSVHNFADNTPSQDVSSECIFIINSVIKKLEVNVFEDISIAKDKKALNLIAGSAMRVKKIDHSLTKEIIRLLKLIPIEKRKTISQMTDDIIDNIYNPVAPNELCRGIDNMAHVSKGIVGIRLDDNIHACIINVNVSDILNIGKPLSEDEIEAAKNRFYADEIHMMDSTLFSPKSYVGNNACGILVSSGKNYTILCSCISFVISKHGYAVGLGINNKVDCAFVENVSIKDIDSINNKHDSGVIAIDEQSCNVTLNMVTYN